MALLDFLSRSRPATTPAPTAATAEPEWVKTDTGHPLAGVPANVSGFLSTARLPKRGTAEILHAYDTMPYLRASVSKIAGSAAAVPLGYFARKNSQGKAILDLATATAAPESKYKRIKALKAADELEEYPEHPLAKLLRNPWPGLRGRTLLKLTFAWLELVGDAFWIFDTNALGMPTAIMPVPPHWVTETPTRDRPYFLVRVPGGMQITVPITNMLWFKDPSLDNPFGRGSGVGATLADELDVDENAAKHVGSYFFNRAMPDMLVSVDGADESALLAAKAKFEQDHLGFQKAYRTAFVNGKVAVARLDTTFKDMDLVELRKFSGRDVVIQALGLSPEMLGILDNSNRATIAEARIMFAQNVLIPRLALVEEVIQEFAYKFDERLIVAFENPTPDDDKFILEVARARPGSRSENEWRALQNLPPVPGGELFYKSLSEAPVRAREEADEDDEDAVPTKPDIVLTPEQVASLTALIAAVVAGSLPKETARQIMLVSYPLSETAINAMLAAIPEHVPVAPAPPFDDTKAVRKNYKAANEDVDGLLESLRPERLTAELRPLAEKTIKEIGTAEADAVGSSGTFNMVNPLVSGFIDKWATVKITGLVDATTREALRETLIDGVRAGESSKDLARRVREVFADADQRRAILIARTEVVGLTNRAIYAAHAMSGVVQRRQWVATSDDRTREVHAQMNGQVQDIGAAFESSSGATGMSPGDMGSADEDCNCRCTTIALVGDQEPRGAVDLGIIQRDFEVRVLSHEQKFTQAARKGFAKQESEMLAAIRRYR